jgi:hexosaminidase
MMMTMRFVFCQSFAAAPPVVDMNPTWELKTENMDANGYSDFQFLKNLQRIVHIDLKGAQPKPDYYRQLIPMLKRFGATGVLLEYEHTFPFVGQLAEARLPTAYTVDDVNLIKSLCKQNNLKLIPLVQTYGHLEWLLKGRRFAHLRENPKHPQVITPCLNQTYDVLYG